MGEHERELFITGAVLCVKTRVTPVTRNSQGSHGGVLMKYDDIAKIERYKK
jgi:hypothetical protein